MIAVSSWDDGGALDTRIADLMDKYDIWSTFYVPLNWQKVNARKGRDSLTLDQLKDIASRFEIGSHTCNHPFLTKISFDSARKEIEEGKKGMQQITGQDVTSFAPPRGYYNEDIKKLLPKLGIEEMRTTMIGHLFVDDPLETHTTVHVYDRPDYNMGWYDYAKMKLNMARAIEEETGKEATYLLWGHSEEVDRFGQFNQLEKFLKELVA